MCSSKDVLGILEEGRVMIANGDYGVDHRTHSSTIGLANAAYFLECPDCNVTSFMTQAQLG